MNQKCSKMTFTSVCVLVTVGALTFWFWPRGDDMETKLETNGNDNKIETSEKKEVSLFHIEKLSSAQTSSNIMTLTGFTIIFFAITYQKSTPAPVVAVVTMRRNSFLLSPLWHTCSESPEHENSEYVW